MINALRGIIKISSADKSWFDESQTITMPSGRSMKGKILKIKFNNCFFF
jgi:hypothetical protein